MTWGDNPGAGLKAYEEQLERLQGLARGRDK